MVSLSDILSVSPKLLLEPCLLPVTSLPDDLGGLNKVGHHPHAKENQILMELV